MPLIEYIALNSHNLISSKNMDLTYKRKGKKKKYQCLIISSMRYRSDFVALCFQDVVHTRGGPLELNMNTKLKLDPKD